MEINVGEFVRTKKQGIKRIDTIFENATVNKYGYIVDYDHNDTIYSVIRIDEILKSSFNLIDLIEIGDYVNGETVKRKFKGNDKNIYLEIIDHKPQWYKHIGNDEIKSVVTKEQFASMEYKVN